MTKPSVEFAKDLLDIKKVVHDELLKPFNGNARENPYSIMDASLIGNLEGSENPHVVGALIEVARPLNELDELYLYAHGARKLGKRDIVTSIPFESTSAQALLRLARRTFVVEMSGNRIAPVPRSYE